MMTYSRAVAYCESENSTIVQLDSNYHHNFEDEYKGNLGKFLVHMTVPSLSIYFLPIFSILKCSTFELYFQDVQMNFYRTVRAVTWFLKKRKHGQTLELIART